jgi:S1-C subfamily serine protease
VIVELDGESIEAAEDLGRVLDTLAPGDTIEVRVIRSDGEERTHRVVLGTKPLPTEFLEP